MNAVTRFALWLWCLTPTLWIERLKGRKRGRHGTR